MTHRQRLPNRRTAHIFPLRFQSQNFTVSIEIFPDGSLAEVFLDSVKAANDMQAMARDSAIILSLARQYGVPLAIMRDAISRDQRNEPQSLIGAALDVIAGEIEKITCISQESA